MPKCELTVNLNIHAPQERLAPHSELVLALCWRFEQPLHCLLCGHQEAITVTINSELSFKKVPVSAAMISWDSLGFSFQKVCVCGGVFMHTFICAFWFLPTTV